VWLDEPGTQRNTLDDRTPSLVNDIDIVLVSPSGKAILPWTLDPNHPTAPAARAVNVRDNVERIDAPTESGIWELRVTGKNWENASEVSAALAIWGFEHVEE
jgi:hypothetical protein